MASDTDGIQEYNEEFRGVVYKATVLSGAGTSVEAPASKQTEEQNRLESLLREGTVIAPPVPPQTLLRIWENSSSLSQNIEAYMTNIEGLGWRLEPVLDFDRPEVREEVREAAWAEADQLSADAVLPDDESVDKLLVELKQRARLEKVRLSTFLNNANPEGSFVSLRRATRQQMEIMGNAFWEVLRNKAGRPARFVLVPTTGVRLTAVDNTPTQVTEKVAAGPLGFVDVVQHRFFRRFVQAVRKSTVYFKEYGDPRIVSRRTGKVYKDKNAWDADTHKPLDDAPATEMLHFKIGVPGEAYGVPRWFGNLLAVLGSRAADEVNYDYFDNKAIPPLALLVAGGSLGKEVVDRIQTYIRDNLKGRQNFHKILVIEAQGSEAQQLAGDAPIPRLSFERLGEMQKDDALFAKYDERNIDKIGSSFRLPRLMRGDVRDFNRATAIASLRFAEDQVFDPERKEFDAQFNRRILPQLDISLWRLCTNGHRTRDPEVVVELIDKLVRRGVLTPNEGREVAADVLGRAFDPIQEFWAKQPLAISLAGMKPGVELPSVGGDGKGSDEKKTPAEGEQAKLEQELAELQEQATRMAKQRDAALDALREQADDDMRHSVQHEDAMEVFDEPLQ